MMQDFDQLKCVWLHLFNVATSLFVGNILEFKMDLAQNWEGDLKHIVCSFMICWVGLSIGWQGDGKPFWRLVVSEATGCDNADYFEEVYEV